MEVEEALEIAVLLETPLRAFPSVNPVLCHLFRLSLLFSALTHTKPVEKYWPFCATKQAISDSTGDQRWSAFLILMLKIHLRIQNGIKMEKVLHLHTGYVVHMLYLPVEALNNFKNDYCRKIVILYSHHWWKHCPEILFILLAILSSIFMSLSKIIS